MPTVEAVEPELKKGEEKPRFVRNREIDKTTVEQAKQHTLPEPPGKILSWDQMHAYLSLLTPEMWAHVLIYVYRVRPKIRRQLVNVHAPSYIECIGEPFTFDWFVSRHGGGRYVFDVLDTDKKPKDPDKPTNLFAGKLFQCTYSIDDAKYEPILDYRELELEARENTSYIIW